LITLKDYEILAPRQIMLFLVWSRALIGVNQLASNGLLLCIFSIINQTHHLLFDLITMRVYCLNSRRVVLVLVPFSPLLGALELNTMEIVLFSLFICVKSMCLMHIILLKTA